MDRQEFQEVKVNKNGSLSIPSKKDIPRAKRDLKLSPDGFDISAALGINVNDKKGDKNRKTRNKKSRRNKICK